MGRADKAQTAPLIRRKDIYARGFRVDSSGLFKERLVASLEYNNHKAPGVLKNNEHGIAVEQHGEIHGPLELGLLDTGEA